MTKQKADVVAMSRLETRIDPRARLVSIKPPAPCDWANSEVVPLRQNEQQDPRELLFVGLTCEFEAIDT